MGFFDALDKVMDGVDVVLERSQKNRKDVANKIYRDKSYSEEQKQRVREKVARNDEILARHYERREDFKKTFLDDK